MEALRIARWRRRVQGSLLMRASTCESSQAWRRRSGFGSYGGDGVRLGVRAVAEKEPRGRAWAARAKLGRSREEAERKDGQAAQELGCTGRIQRREEKNPYLFSKLISK